MKIITGTTGSPHITPLQDSMWHRALTVVDSCVLNFGNNFEPQIMTNNLVRVKSGICSLQGRFMCIEPNTYDEVTIENGAQSMQRIDIICGKITIDNQGKSTATLEVIKGTPARSNPQPPTIPTGDLDDGDTEAYIPLVEIRLNGINLTTATMIGDTFSREVKKLLWENASPTSAFAAQSINLDGTYDSLEIVFEVYPNGSTDDDKSTIRVISSGELYAKACAIGGSRNQELTTRLFKNIGNIVRFEQAYIGDGSSTARTPSANHLVPLKIYGIKEG